MLSYTVGEKGRGRRRAMKGGVKWGRIMMANSFVKRGGGGRCIERDDDFWVGEK